MSTKIIVDVGRPQHWYVGDVDSFTAILPNIKGGNAFTLKNVYQIIAIHLPNMEGDIVCNTRITPCGFNRGSVKSMLVRAVAVYQADLEEDGFKMLERQIKVCEDDIKLQAAQDAGIDTSAGRRPGKPGMVS